MSTSMFPVHNQGKTYPVQFRAGKLLREGDTKLVKPDPRQGMVMMDVGADHLTRFYWKDVKNNVIEDDLIVFPQEAVFEKVAESSQRVYVLKFNSSSQRLFFWMQDPKDEKDAENVARINQIINDPLSVNPAVAGDGLSQQIMRMFDQNYREESASRSQAAPAGQLSNPQLSELRNIISNIEVPASQQAPLDLSRVLTPQAIGPLLNNPQICQALFPHLPESTSRTREEIEEVVRSSQFQQALRSLGAALESRALARLCNSLAWILQLPTESKLSSVPLKGRPNRKEMIKWMWMRVYEQDFLVDSRRYPQRTGRISPNRAEVKDFLSGVVLCQATYT